MVFDSCSEQKLFCRFFFEGGGLLFRAEWYLFASHTLSTQKSEFVNLTGS